MRARRASHWKRICAYAWRNNVSAFRHWQDYFYPETYSPVTGDGVLRNILGIRIKEALENFEQVATAERGRVLAQIPGIIPRTFNAAHVRAIHKYLFQDVYEWAGEYRSAQFLLYKGGTAFAAVGDGSMENYLHQMQEIIMGTHWADLERDGFAGAAANVYAHLNQAHPFREGNGRCGKVFMDHVAALSPFDLDYNLIDPELWNQQSMLSAPDLGTLDVVPASLVPVFHRIAVPRDVVETPLHTSPSRASAPTGTEP